MGCPLTAHRLRTPHVRLSTTGVAERHGGRGQQAVTSQQITFTSRIRRFVVNSNNGITGIQAAVVVKGHHYFLGALYIVAGMGCPLTTHRLRTPHVRLVTTDVAKRHGGRGQQAVTSKLITGASRIRRFYVLSNNSLTGIFAVAIQIGDHYFIGARCIVAGMGCIVTTHGIGSPVIRERTQFTGVVDRHGSRGQQAVTRQFITFTGQIRRFAAALGRQRN